MKRTSPLIKKALDPLTSLALSYLLHRTTDATATAVLRRPGSAASEHFYPAVTAMGMRAGYEGGDDLFPRSRWAIGQVSPTATGLVDYEWGKYLGQMFRSRVNELREKHPHLVAAVNPTGLRMAAMLRSISKPRADLGPEQAKFRELLLQTPIGGGLTAQQGLGMLHVTDLQSSLARHTRTALLNKPNSPFARWLWRIGHGKGSPAMPLVADSAAGAASGGLLGGFKGAVVSGLSGLLTGDPGAAMIGAAHGAGVGAAYGGAAGLAETLPDAAMMQSISMPGGGNTLLRMKSNLMLEGMRGRSQPPGMRAQAYNAVQDFMVPAAREFRELGADYAKLRENAVNAVGNVAGSPGVRQVLRADRAVQSELGHHADVPFAEAVRRDLAPVGDAGRSFWSWLRSRFRRTPSALKPLK